MSRQFIIVCVVMLSVACGKEDKKVNEYQEKADKMKWNWPGPSNPLWCSVEHLPDYNVEIIKPKRDELKFDESKIRFRITDGDKEIYSYDGHPGTVFTRINSVIYLADYEPNGSGCSVVAFDLSTKKQLWKAAVKPIVAKDVSKYSNSVLIINNGEVIAVNGKESGGRYIEFLDPKTGNSLGSKVFPNDQE